eukprot:m.759201 g.759201  ORF g.759201 m.759201 type:complete len:300 (-) comp23194_c0_seq30:2390-3289(-)
MAPLLITAAQEGDAAQFDNFLRTVALPECTGVQTGDRSSLRQRCSNRAALPQTPLLERQVAFDVLMSTRDLGGCTSLVVAAQNGNQHIVDLVPMNPSFGKACMLFVGSGSWNFDLESRWCIAILRFHEMTETLAIVLQILREYALSTEDKHALLEAGDMNNRCALHHAVLRNDMETVVCLLIFGASVDTIDIKGFTPLHFCTSAAIARVLLERGADPLTRSIGNRTALQHMIRLGVEDTRLLQLLRKHEQLAQGQDQRDVLHGFFSWKVLVCAAVFSGLMTYYLALSLDDGRVPMTVRV